MFRVEVDASAAIAMTKEVRRQVPFAMSRAVNDVAKAVQTAQRGRMDQRFMLRRKAWAHRSVKISQFANKATPIAEIRIETPGDPGRSDVLTKFESGGTKRPKDGRRLAVPDAARRGKRGVVREGMRPKDFDFQLLGRGPKAGVFVGQNRTFMIKRPDGTGGIYQRTGRETKKRSAGQKRIRDGRDLNLKTLYRFTPQATIDSRLDFVQTAGGIFRAEFSRTFEGALQKAIDSGRSVDVKGGRSARGDNRQSDGSLLRATREARRVASADMFGWGRRAR